MKKSTLSRREAARQLQADGDWWLIEKIITKGKEALDEIQAQMGKCLVEAVMLMEREQIAGPDYHPCDPHIHKWASQGGSVFIGTRKQKVEVPRLRGPQGEIPLRTYASLKSPGVMSRQLLAQWLAGMSARRYSWLIEDAVQRCGMSKSSVSRHLVAASAKKLPGVSGERFGRC